MKNKDNELLAEAYDKVLEANFVQNAVNTGRYAVNSLIDKGKNVLGIKAPERSFGQSWAKWAEGMGIEPPPFSERNSDGSYDKVAQAAWEKKYPAAAAYINNARKQRGEEEAFNNSPEGIQKSRDEYSDGISRLNVRAGLTPTGMPRLK
jgi:hypothetical protein